MGYLKRNAAPKFWPIKRKGVVWTVKPSAGPHPADASLPLLIVIRDVLKLADNAGEAKQIITQGKVLVDNKPRKDYRFTIGPMDILEMPDLGKVYMVDVTPEGLGLVEVGKRGEPSKICRIENKVTVRGGLHQLNLHDGRNILTDNNEYKPGDSILIQLPGQAILKHLKLGIGANVKIIGGRNSGLEGTIKGISGRKTLLERNKVIVDIGTGDVETLKKYVLVIEKGQPAPSGEEPKAKKRAAAKSK